MRSFDWTISANCNSEADSSKNIWIHGCLPVPSKPAKKSSRTTFGEDRIQITDGIKNSAHYEQGRKDTCPHGATEGQDEGLPGVVRWGFRGEKGQALEIMRQAELHKWQISLKKVQVSNGKTGIV